MPFRLTIRFPPPPLLNCQPENAHPGSSSSPKILRRPFTADTILADNSAF